MKIAVACSLSNSHVVFLDHFIKSVLEHNPKFNKDWLIFCRKTNNIYRLSLSEKNRKHLLSLYPRFKFVSVDLNKYAKYGKSEVIFYSIELFNQNKYDRIIFWGADMICMGKLGELFRFAKDINGIGMPKEKRRECWNNGSMIVGQEFLNKKTYNELLVFEHDHPRYKRHFGHDQKIYNIYFKKYNVKNVHQKWNTLVSEIDFIKYKDIKIMHYFYKPTQDVGRRDLTKWQIDLWEKYDNPLGRNYGMDT